jgi:retron-type reverse transcriptase
MLDPVLPEEQFGYRPGRSTSLAAGSLLQHIRTELEKPRGKLYAVFVDYSKAFDMINRELTINELEGLIGRTKLTTLISNILADNQIQIDDGIGKSQWLIQTNDVLQGDPLSPILFNALTHDVGAKIKEGTDTMIYMYADDMALVSGNIPDLQKTVDLLSIWAQTN